VERFPQDPERYIGIGRGDKKAHPGDYRERAQSAALAQISREISMRLSVENKLVLSEGKAGREEDYAQSITGSSRNDLSGYQLDGVFETENDFWVCYALDKEKFQRSWDERDRGFAAWLAAERKALDADLDARRIEAALDRFRRVEEKYASDYTGRPLPRNSPTDVPARYQAMADTLRSIIGGLEMETVPSAWTLEPWSLEERTLEFPIPKFPNSGAGKNHDRAAVFLSEARTGRKWKGALSLSLTDPLHPEVPACHMETGPEGRLDLAYPFLACGLEPGIWRVTWRGLDGQALAIDVPVGIHAREMGLAIQGKGAAVDILAVLEQELAAPVGPCCAVTIDAVMPQAVRADASDAARPAPPKVDIDILEISADSLEGMHFTAIRGTVRIPGVLGSFDVTGKSGHADPARSRARAAHDFANEVKRHLNAKALAIIISNCPLR